MVSIYISYLHTIDWFLLRSDWFLLEQANSGGDPEAKRQKVSEDKDKDKDKETPATLTPREKLQLFVNVLELKQTKIIPKLNQSRVNENTPSDPNPKAKAKAQTLKPKT